jgi:FkbM family methyltransferase
MGLKDLIRSILSFLHLDLTKNLEYDRLTKKIMQGYLKKDSNCIDIGCHKGEILELILKYSPDGEHYAFEPIPLLFDQIKSKYASKANVFPFALAAKEGITNFHYVKNAPAYSGLKKRRYEVKNPDIEEIKVELRRLDDIIPDTTSIDLIKIDVEGAEYGVLQGAVETLKRNKPLVIFEFGLGASDFYNTTPKDIYTLLVNEVGLKIYTLTDWLQKGQSLTIGEFSKHFNSNGEYYFVAN